MLTCERANIQIVFVYRYGPHRFQRLRIVFRQKLFFPWLNSSSFTTAERAEMAHERRWEERRIMQEEQRRVAVARAARAKEKALAEAAAKAEAEAEAVRVAKAKAKAKARARALWGDGGTGFEPANLPKEVPVFTFYSDEEEDDYAEPGRVVMKAKAAEAGAEEAEAGDEWEKEQPKVPIPHQRYGDAGGVRPVDIHIDTPSTLNGNGEF